MTKELVTLIITAVAGVLYALIGEGFPLTEADFTEVLIWIVISIFFGGTAEKLILRKKGKIRGD